MLRIEKLYEQRILIEVKPSNKHAYITMKV